MPGYEVTQARVAIGGADDLQVRSLLDRQQFSDPQGLAARVGISPASWPLFGLIWPSGLQLAAQLAGRPVHRGERILEVGCGLALASLVGHRAGADITASDCHPLAGSFIAANLRLNGLPPMKYRQGHWGAPRPDPQDPPSSAWPRAVCGRFDLIIGSDVLYERDERASLASFIGEHARACAEVWIVDPDRGNRPAFRREMSLQGFRFSERRLDRAASGTTAAYKGRLMRFVRDDGAGAPGVSATEGRSSPP